MPRVIAPIRRSALSCSSPRALALAIDTPTQLHLASSLVRLPSEADCINLHLVGDP
jgi:hypothetical protein